MQNITRLLPAGQIPRFPDPQSAVETDSAADVSYFYSAGVPVRHIFLHADGLGREELHAAQGKCRFLVRSPAALAALDQALDDMLPAGQFEPVGLCIGPDGFARDIPALSAALRRTDNLTLRYVFLSLDGAADPALAAREAFSFLKRLRSELPCMLHGFCLKGLLKPLAGGDEALAETLNMLAALNDSSLYAEFFIG